MTGQDARHIMMMTQKMNVLGHTKVQKTAMKTIANS